MAPQEPAGEYTVAASYEAQTDGEDLMSGLDQPLLIATTGYHVGHQRSIRAAEEQGYFAEEGLKEYVYDYRGLIPGPFEREGLALAMKEHGVDIAAGANVDSAILQRAKGAEIFIVGGWRYVTRPKIVSAKNITRVEQRTTRTSSATGRLMRSPPVGGLPTS